MGCANSSLSYWGRSRFEVGREAQVLVRLLPIIGTEDKIRVLVELVALLDVASVGRHGC
jgi:hypothetical protein